MNLKNSGKPLKRANNYDEAIAYFELRCSPYFEEKGFRTDTYIDYEKYEDRVYNATIQTSINLLREDRCPFIKRRALNLRYNAFLYFCNGQQPAETLKFLKEHTDYDISLIWENLLRTDYNSVLRQTHIRPISFRQICPQPGVIRRKLPSLPIFIIRNLSITVSTI